jgi:hypothetical protein
MPELTPQDRESYQKLRTAIEQLNTSITSISDNKVLTTLKGLTLELWDQVKSSGKPKNFEELQGLSEVVGGYLAIYKIFAKQVNSLKSGNPPAPSVDIISAISSAHQELLAEYTKLSGFIKAADDDFIDEIVSLRSDPLFLGFLEDIKDEPKIKIWTQQLMSDQAPALGDGKVQKLVDAWGTAVTKFLEDAQKGNAAEDQAVPGESNTIAHFLAIHDQLDGLYSQLSTTVALNN